MLNLYPFERAILREDATFDTSVENIDIGGPSMLRSAAKNHRFVTVATRPEQYDVVLKALEANNGRVSRVTTLCHVILSQLHLIETA